MEQYLICHEFFFIFGVFSKIIKMPYNITWEPQGVFIKWFDKCTYKENIEANGMLYGDKRFDSILYQISDILDADTSTFTNQDVTIIAKLEMKATVWNKNMLVAHITKNKELIEQIRLYEAEMKDSNWRFGIFDSLEEARTWIEKELESNSPENKDSL